MNKDVYILDTNIYEYNNSTYFNPSTKYKEALDIAIKSDERIYDKVRNLFILMKLDEANIGKNNWNPFKDFIKQNNCVVIKPNLVKHINVANNGTTDSLITNFAVIRPVIDYCILALNGTGRIIVGDAPVQECIFSEVIKINGLEEGIKEYRKKGYDIELIDFRKNQNENLECTIVNLDDDSSLCDVDEYCKQFAITNYNLKYMHEHHHDGKHEYLIANNVLNADVIINLPKPKVHRKAGMTACMKNFVGVNGKKEYLPHHRNGSIYSNGDEYPEKSFLKKVNSNLKNYSYKHNFLIDFLRRIVSLILRINKKNRFMEGSWYGNDTIWRTILDLNKIILYSDKQGNLKEDRQRTIFNIADMIISGEKEGPLLPSDKPVGLLVASFNQLNMDRTIAEIMGFDSNKIKYIKNGYELEKYKISETNKFNTYINGENIDAKMLNKNFIPTDGWIDYLLEK